MATFKNTMNNLSYTENGALTFSSSGSDLLNFFALGGALRTRDESEIIRLFNKAFDDNPRLAMRALFYIRNPRGGQGEKKTFRVAIRNIIDTKKIDLYKLADLIVEFGSWKDIFTTFTDNEVALIVKNELARRRKDGKFKPSLMEKYIYSIGGKDNKRAEKLAYALGITPRQYRKWLSKARAEIKIVEQKMCSNDWNNIDYEIVPSKAMLNYSNAFNRHSPTRFQEYISKVKDGKAKINASVISPNEIVRKAILSNLTGYKTSAEQDDNLNVLWKNLPNYDVSDNAIVVCDTSGSMSINNYTPMSISIALAIYFAERNNGMFKNQMITFSDRPEFFEILGNDCGIVDRVGQILKKANWGYNTNLQKVFDLILERCHNNHVPESEMPKRIIIVSDMEFDYACGGKTNFEVIKEKYARYGYNMPEVVFWNADSKQDNIPVTKDENGVSLVSGSSPSLFEAIAKAEKLDPIAFMLNVIMNPIYDKVDVFTA